MSIEVAGRRQSGLFAGEQVMVVDQGVATLSGELDDLADLVVRQVPSPSVVTGTGEELRFRRGGAGSEVKEKSVKSNG